MLAHNLCKTLFLLLVSAFAVAAQQAPAPRVVDLTAPDGLKLRGHFCRRGVRAAPVQPEAWGVGRLCDAHDDGA